jgi:hypothetical protein
LRLLKSPPVGVLVALGLGVDVGVVVDLFAGVALFDGVVVVALFELVVAVFVDLLLVEVLAFFTGLLAAPSREVVTGFFTLAFLDFFGITSPFSVTGVSAVSLSTVAGASVLSGFAWLTTTKITCPVLTGSPERGDCSITVFGFSLADNFRHFDLCAL